MPKAPTEEEFNKEANEEASAESTYETSPRNGLGDRIRHLADLFGLVCEVPAEWLKDIKRHAKKRGTHDGVTCVPCSSWNTLLLSWRKALKWTLGLDCGLSVMLASITSTKAVGDQLWVKIIGPASCGKSTLCEALSINTKYCLPKSTIRGFHSGWKGEGGDEDLSLITQVRDKTLITKDGDTLLQSPNLGQILAEARDVYDRTSRSDFRNGMGRSHEGVNMTWLLCGTASLRLIDSSELGERFLDCVVMEGIDDDFEDEVLWRVANRVDRSMGLEASGAAGNSYEPELLEAMELTGGYVSYLRENATMLLSQVVAPEAALRRCTRLGKFVAFMRARPSKSQDENTEREFAARLTSQLTRLAKCLAVVLNKSIVDNDVMHRVTKVAFDTSRGITLDMVHHIYASEHGMTIGSLAQHTNHTEDRTRTMLRFLCLIGVVELNKKPSKAGTKTNQSRWILTERIRKLYQEVEWV